MDFSGSAWLERNTRQVEENSNLTVSKLPMNDNSVVADIGAGTGYYTFKIYNRIPKGKIYAEEIQTDAVNYLKNKAGQLGAMNIIVSKAMRNHLSFPKIALTWPLW